jgi:hypothetical protein
MPGVSLDARSIANKLWLSAAALLFVLGVVINFWKGWSGLWAFWKQMSFSNKLTVVAIVAIALGAVIHFRPYWPGWRESWKQAKFDNKLMVISTIVIAIATIVNVVVSRAMWKEMENGGVDTHNLATSTYNLATASQTEATNTGALASAAGKQADAAKVQSYNTVKLADAASKQANAAADQVTKLQAGVDQSAKLATNTGTANGIAAETFEAQTRPWIEIRTDPSEFEQAGWGLRFNLGLSNSGHSPAIGVSIDPQFWLLPNKYDTDFVFENFPICGANKKFKPDGQPGIDTTVIFPGETASNIFPVANIPSDARPGPLSYFNLAGCIVYAERPNGPIYQTRVIYNISEFISGAQPFVPPVNQKIVVLRRALYDVQEVQPIVVVPKGKSPEAKP